MCGKGTYSRAKTARVIRTTGIKDGDLVNFHRPKGIGTIEEVGVISFEPQAPSKISRLDSLLPSDSFLHSFHPLNPAHLQLLAVRLMR